MRTIANAQKIDRILAFLVEDGNPHMAQGLHDKAMQDTSVEDLRLLLAWIANDFSSYVSISNTYSGHVISSSDDTAYFLQSGGAEGVISNAIQKQEHEAFQVRMAKSVVDTNVSVRSTNKAQKISIGITGIAIVVSCVFQVRTWYVTNEQLETSKQQYKLDSLKQKSDSLTIDGLKEKTNSIQKQLDEMRNAKKS